MAGEVAGEVAGGAAALLTLLPTALCTFAGLDCEILSATDFEIFSGAPLTTEETDAALSLTASATADET